MSEVDLEHMPGLHTVTYRGIPGQGRETSVLEETLYRAAPSTNGSVTEALSTPNGKMSQV